MRGWIFFLTLTLILPKLAFAANTPNAFRGQIYSFNQLMQLTPAKRAQYLADLREIVLAMEKQQKGFEIADAGRVQEMKDQIAGLLQMSSFLPEATAAEDAAPVRSAFSPSSASAPVAATNDLCRPPEKLACKDMDQTQRDKLKAEFRAQKPNSCITSGNFTKYRNNVPKPGNCSYVYSFPSDKAANKINCDRGEALCNPLLFCAGVDVDLNGTQQFLLAPICVNLGQDMTKTCQTKYLEATEKRKNTLDFTALKKKHRAIFDQARKATPRTCDFSKDLANFSGIKEKYDELKVSVEDRYKNLCIGNSPYQAMFCAECEIIGQQIYVANTKGGLGGCATVGSSGTAESAKTPAETAE